MAEISLTNPRTGQIKQVPIGFSWTTLLGGCFVMLYRKWWSMAAITFVAALFSYGIAWLVFPFFINKMWIKHLIRREGYKPANEEAQKHLQMEGIDWELKRIAHSDKDYLDQLEKLAALKEKGVLTEEEFLIKKQEILKTVAR